MKTVYRINKNELKEIVRAFGSKIDLSSFSLDDSRKPFEKRYSQPVVLTSNISIRLISENSGEWTNIWVDEGEEPKIIGMGKYVAELIIKQDKEPFLRHFFNKVINKKDFKLNIIRYWKCEE